MNPEAPRTVERPQSSPGRSSDGFPRNSGNNAGNGREPAAQGTAVAYVVGRYPAISHTFVMREVQSLRRLGAHVETISIHRAPAEDLLSDEDHAEARSTFAVLPISALRLVRVHALAMLRRPARYLSTLFRALAMSPPGTKGHVWQLFYFAEAIVVADRCRQAGVRHLHAQFADQATDVAMLAARYGGPGWTWSLAVHGPVEFYNLERNRLAAKVRDASLVQTISHFGRSQVLTLLDESEWDKVHVVRCGVDAAAYEPPRAARSSSSAELAVLCVGRLVHWKGQTLLVEAVAELARRGIDVRLDLVGSGPKRRELEEMAARLDVAHRVRLVGAVGQDEIASYYAAADVFCLPSFAEGIPVVLMEAMAYERPVVATRIMGVPELVEDGVSGLLVPPGDLPPLVAAIEALAADPERRIQLGRAGRRKVLEEYDVRHSAAQLHTLFAHALTPD